MTQIQNQMAIRIVKNEKLLCQVCLISSAGPVPDEAVLCHLDRSKDELKNKKDFCSNGLWIINGEVVDFKRGFQLLHASNATGEDKEIKI